MARVERRLPGPRSGRNVYEPLVLGKKGPKPTKKGAAPLISSRIVFPYVRVGEPISTEWIQKSLSSDEHMVVMAVLSSYHATTGHIPKDYADTEIEVRALWHGR